MGGVTRVVRQRAFPLVVLLAVLAGTPRPATAEGVEEEAPFPASPFLAPGGVLQTIVRPEFRGAPSLLDDLAHFGVEGLDIALVGPFVPGATARDAPVPSRLVLSGSPEAVARGREVLAYLDVPQPAVVVSLLATEVQCRTDAERGGHLAFARDLQVGPNTLFRGVFSEFEPDSYLRSSLAGTRPFQGSTFRFGNRGDDILSNGAFEYVLRYLAEQSEADFLAWPTVVCTEGRPAIVTSIEQAAQRVVRASDTTGRVLIENQSAERGVIFKLQAVRVGADAAVLDLEADFLFLTPQAPDGAAAGEVTTLRRRVATRVTVADQESLLIGGLRIRRRQDSGRGLPLVSRLPGLSERTNRCEDTELLLLLRARILVPDRGAYAVLPPGEARRLEVVRRLEEGTCGETGPACPPACPPEGTPPVTR